MHKNVLLMFSMMYISVFRTWTSCLCIRQEILSQKIGVFFYYLVQHSPALYMLGSSVTQNRCECVHIFGLCQPCEDPLGDQEYA